MPRSLFPAFLGGTASLAPWWPFSSVLLVAGAWGIAGWGRGGHGLAPVSPSSWSLITRLPVPQGIRVPKALADFIVGRGQKEATVDAGAWERSRA